MGEIKNSIATVRTCPTKMTLDLYGSSVLRDYVVAMPIRYAFKFHVPDHSFFYLNDIKSMEVGKDQDSIQST